MLAITKCTSQTLQQGICYLKEKSRKPNSENKINGMEMERKNSVPFRHSYSGLRLPAEEALFLAFLRQVEAFRLSPLDCLHSLEKHNK